MTEPLSHHESAVDKQIRMATERGDFDDLPGMGEPLPGRGREDDDLWWVRQFMRREGLSADAHLPTGLRLAKEVERLPDTVRRLPSEQVVRETVAKLNREIADYLRMPSGPYAPLSRVDADEIVQQWRAARISSAGSAPTTPGAAPAPTRRGRWFRRRRKSA